MTRKCHTRQLTGWTKELRAQKEAKAQRGTEATMIGRIAELREPRDMEPRDTVRIQKEDEDMVILKEDKP